MENLIYSWTFDDKKERSSTWYIVFLSIMVGLVIWGFLTKQYGMSFVIILVSGLIYFIENNSADTIEVQINELGIKIAENFYDFSKIQNYGFIYDGEQATSLRLKISKSSISQLDLGVNNQIAGDLREILPNFLNETPDTERTFTEKIIKLLKL